MTRGSVFWNVNRTPTLEGSPKYLPWRCGSNRRLRGLILWLCGIPLLERVEQQWFHRQPIALDRRGFKLVLAYTQQLKIEGEEPSQISRYCFENSILLPVVLARAFSRYYNYYSHGLWTCCVANTECHK